MKVPFVGQGIWFLANELEAEVFVRIEIHTKFVFVPLDKADVDTYGAVLMYKEGQGEFIDKQAQQRFLKEGWKPAHRVRIRVVNEKQPTPPAVGIVLKP